MVFAASSLIIRFKKYYIIYYIFKVNTDLGNHRLNKNTKSLIIQVAWLLRNDLLDRNKRYRATTRDCPYEKPNARWKQ